MNILVTGGGGFLGSAVVERLRRSGHQVAAPRSTMYDLRRVDHIHLALAETRPEVVVHLAAIVGGIGANQVHPGQFLFENAVMGLQLIEESRLAGVRKVVVIGTACSYPAHAPLPLSEENIWHGYPAQPTASYGLAKRMLLAQGQAYREEYGLNVIHLIPTNLYGPGDRFDLETGHVVASLVRKFSEAHRKGTSRVTCWGSGLATREFIYVKDAAWGIALATERYDDPEPVNIGSGKDVTISALAQEIAVLYGYMGRIEWDRDRPDGAPRRRLDVSRAWEKFGFRATTDMRDGLAKTVEWYEANAA